MGNRKLCDQFGRWWSVRQAWRETWNILRLLNRRAELERLVRWAERKRLAGPRRCYAFHLVDVERLLFRYRVNSPAATHWALCLYRLKCLLFPPPRYLARGAAASYARSGHARSGRSYSFARQQEAFAAHSRLRLPRYPALHLSPGSLERRYGWK